MKKSKSTIKLGDKARDTISGFEGVVTCISDWLNGCRRVTIQPEKLHDGKPIDNCCFDIEQLEKVVKAKPRKVTKTGGPAIAAVQRPDATR